jgi:DNA helicase Pif1-like protein
VKKVPTPFLLCFPSSLRLTLTNCNVEHIATYFSQDVIKEMDSYIPSANERDLLSMLHEPGVPPHQLSLKVGSIASIMRNLCIERGLVKNARVRITALLRNVVRVELLQTSNLSSTSDENVYLFPRINFEFKPRRANWTVQRRQFPLRLAYASTLNSCQGLTLDRVVLDLTRPVFAHGQLNTGLLLLPSKLE